MYLFKFNVYFINDHQTNINVAGTLKYGKLLYSRFQYHNFHQCMNTFLSIQQLVLSSFQFIIILLIVELS